MVKILSNREYNNLQRTKIRFEVEIEKITEDLQKEKEEFQMHLEEEFKTKKIELDKEYNTKMHDMRIKCKDDMEKLKSREATKRDLLEKEFTKMISDSMKKLEKTIDKKLK